MNRTFRSIFSIMVAVAMVFTALPIGAFAEESGALDSPGASDCICESLCDGENANTDCLVCAEDYTLCAYEAEDEIIQGDENRDSLMATPSVTAGTAVTAPAAEITSLDLSTANSDTSGDNYAWVHNSQTLTLTDFTLTTTTPDEVSTGQDKVSYAVRLPAGSKIVLNGTNTIKNEAASSTCAVYGIWALGDLTVEGTGALNVTTSTSNADGSVGDSRGIMVGGKFTMNSGTLTSTGNTSTNSDSDGIKVMGAFDMKGGTVNATGGSAGKNGCGLAVDTFTMSAGVLNVTGATGTGTVSNSGGLYSNYAFIMTGGTITALGAGAPETYGIGGGSTFSITGGNITTTGGTATTHSRGFHAWNTSTFTVGETANIIANGGTAPSGNSIGLFSGGTVTITGGTTELNGTDYGLSATTAININYSSATDATFTAKGVKAFNKAPTLTGIGSWKTAEGGSYTDTTTAAYSYNASQNYVSLKSVGGAPITVTSVTIKTAPTKTTYTAGDALDLSGLVVTLNKSNSTTEDVAFANFGTKNITTSPINGTVLTTSNTSVTITYTTDNKTVNQAITVNAVAANYIITLSANPLVGGSVSGGGTFASGTSRTVTATANSDYTFINWMENGVVVSTNANYTFNVTADRTLVANFLKNEGNVEIEPKQPTDNAPAPKLPDQEAVRDAVLTEQDYEDINSGATITISLEVKEETPPPADQSAVESEIAASQEVGMYLDISMFKQKNSEQRQSITNLNAPIQIEFDVPTDLRKSGRTFSVIRAHGTPPTATTLPNLSSSVNKILFETDKFSTYALVYSDTSNPTPTPTPTPSSRSSGGGSSKQDSYTPAPNPWLEPTPAKSLASGANKAQQDSVRTKSTDTYGVRKASWQNLKGYRYYHDTMEGNAVQVRLYIDNPAAMNRDVYVTGFVKGFFVDNRKAFFEKWFVNQVRVIYMDEAEPWGQEVQIAAKVDLAGMDTKKLYFYAYDKKANKYTRIAEPKYWIDKNGYLHFYTELAGDFVISENPLEKKF